MAKFGKVKLKDAKNVKKKVGRQAKILEEYKGYILAIDKAHAGKFTIENDKEGFAVRNRLKRAAEALNTDITIKKRGNEMYFWTKRIPVIGMAGKPFLYMPKKDMLQTLDEGTKSATD